MFRRGPGRLEMCFYAYKNVLEPMGHLGANLIFFILTLNQVLLRGLLLPQGLVPAPEVRMLDVDYMSISSPCTAHVRGLPFHMGSRLV